MSAFPCLQQLNRGCSVDGLAFPEREDEKRVLDGRRDFAQAIVEPCSALRVSSCTTRWSFRKEDLSVAEAPIGTAGVSGVEGPIGKSGAPLVFRAE